MGEVKWTFEPQRQLMNTKLELVDLVLKLEFDD
jgi:hypothetical protein